MSVHRRGVWSQGGGLVPGWGHLVPVGVPAPGGGCLVERPLPTVTAAGGTHPTGMHSCLTNNFVQLIYDLVIDE